jgi:hypothetical protein
VHSPGIPIGIGARAARMLRSSAAWATSFAMSATSATGNSPINAAQLGADGGQGGAPLGGGRLLHEAVAPAENLGLVEHALALSGPG